jgi:hypothetical protein
MMMVVAPVIHLQVSRRPCRKLAYSFWQYLISRLKGDESIPYLPDVIRAKAALKNEVFSIPIEATILT